MKKFKIGPIMYGRTREFEGQPSNWSEIVEKAKDHSVEVLLSCVEDAIKMSPEERTKYVEENNKEKGYFLITPNPESSFASTESFLHTTLAIHTLSTEDLNKLRQALKLLPNDHLFG